MSFSTLPARATLTPTSTPGPVRRPATVRELLVELTRLEDEMRAVPTFAGRGDPTEGAGTHHDLVDLAVREREILAALRAASARWPASPATSADLGQDGVGPRG